MANYRRWYVPGGCNFFTVVLQNRKSSLLTENIELLREAFSVVKEKHPFDINAIVVLPEHLHCIWTLPSNDDDFSLRWRLIKGYFSRKLPDNKGITTARNKPHQRVIWQRRFWEHYIRCEADFHRHIEYIYYNPVKHGYCETPFQWPFSSIHYE